MTAALVSEHRLGRQSSVLSPWRVPQARCIYRECFSFDVVSINQFTIFVSIDPYIPTVVKKSLTMTNRPCDRRARIHLFGPNSFPRSRILADSFRS